MKTTYQKGAINSLVAAVALAAGSVHAGGFGVTVQSATGGGNAATGHALAEDASSMYYNPALLSNIEGKQINAGIGLLNTDITVTNRNSTIPTGAGGTLINGNNTVEPGGLSVTPSFYYKRDLTNMTSFGLGVNVPFGVSTEYEKDSFTRYEALESELKTVNINPALSWQVNDEVSLGAGVNIQAGHAKLSRATDSALVCALALSSAACSAAGLGTTSNANTDGKSTVEADDVAFGANVGMAYQPDKDTTLSIAYRSSVEYDLEGDVTFENNAILQALGGGAVVTGAGLVNQKATAKLKMPASLSIAAAKQMNDKLAVHGDVTWTQWSSIPEIRIKFPDSTTLSDSVTDLQWEDTIRVGVGGTYQLNDKTKVRAGIAFDPTPTPSSNNRTPRAPSSDNWWFSAGMSHDLSKKMTLDASLSYVKPDDNSINYTTPGAINYTTRADVESNVLSGAVSVNYRF